MTPATLRTRRALLDHGPATVTEVADATGRRRTAVHHTLRCLERDGLALCRWEDGPGGPQQVWEPSPAERALALLRERGRPVPYSEVAAVLGDCGSSLQRLRERGLAVNWGAGWVAGSGEAWEAARQLGLEHWRLYAWLAEQHEPVRRPEGSGRLMRELRQVGAVLYLGGGLWVAG